MPERTRKRLFRRSLHGVSITDDSQAVLHKQVQEANEYLLKIAELEEELQPYSCDVHESSAEVPKTRIATGDAVKASLQRLEEAIAFLRQIAGLDEHAGHEVKSTEQKADVQTEPSVHVSDTAAHTEGDDDRLWNEFVMERSSKKVGEEPEKEKKKKNRLRKIVARLFSRK